MFDLHRIPDPFLEVRVKELNFKPGLIGLCAGYEAGSWRCDQLAFHLMEWLPDFALNYREREILASHNAYHQMVNAAKMVYGTKKTQNRGEIGELLLHIAIRQVFQTIPAISKIFYKDSTNDTVKGFDAVHVIVTATNLELWLGESKFYSDIHIAIRDVIKELNDHTERLYLRNEFLTITNKIESEWPYAKQLQKLLDPNVSLDDVFSCVCIPIFLTYESGVIGSNHAVTAKFLAEFDKEVREYYEIFAKKDLPKDIRIHLFLLPLKTKKELIDEFDQKLTGLKG
jgi:hypothetical protein